MNPVVGIDVPKGSSQGQAFLDRNQPFKKCFHFVHTEEGLQSFFQIFQELERVNGYDQPLPSTSCSGSREARMFIDHGESLMLGTDDNPVQRKRMAVIRSTL
jgi:hypothetical protein